MPVPLLMRCMTYPVSITLKWAVRTQIVSLEGFLHSTALVCLAILHYTHLHEYLNIADIRKMELILKFKGEA